MASKGFAYPTLIGENEKDLRAALQRNLRYIEVFFNSYVARYDENSNLILKNGATAGSGYSESASEDLTTKGYVDTAIEDLATEGYVDTAISGLTLGNVILAAGSSVSSTVPVGTTESSVGTVTLYGLGASQTIWVDVTVSLRIASLAVGTYMWVRPGVNGLAQGSYPAVQSAQNLSSGTPSSSTTVANHRHSIASLNHRHFEPTPSEFTTYDDPSPGNTGYTQPTASTSTTHSVTQSAPSYTTVSQRRVVSATADGSGSATISAFVKVSSGSYTNQVVDISYVVYTR